jgi:potassium-transporting ATPase KdpC subunit
MLRTIFSAVALLIVFIVVTGLIYPLAVTGLAQLFFPFQANGSIMIRDSKPIGSILIGQHFDDPKYFWGRPSATQPYPYNASSSSGSNLAQSNPVFLKTLQGRVVRLKAADPANDKPIPIDLITSSGSGLDPHISLAAAEYQAQRVAGIRGLDKDIVLALIAIYSDKRQFGILGQPTVNVLNLNLALDRLQQKMDK